MARWAPPRIAAPSPPLAGAALQLRPARLQPPSPHARVIQRLTSKQKDDAEGVLGTYWKTMRTAGAVNAALVFAAGGVHACGARVTVGVHGALAAQTFTANYAGGCHAEMAGLQAAITAGYPLTAVQSIEIEKEPCPRCAVILNRAGVAGTVTYKNAGQKDNRGWQFPAFVNKDTYLQITAQIAAAGAAIFGTPVVGASDIEYLASRFADQNWWS